MSQIKRLKRFIILTMYSTRYFIYVHMYVYVCVCVCKYKGTIVLKTFDN